MLLAADFRFVVGAPMGRPQQDVIETFMSVTGASEAVALQKLEVQLFAGKTTASSYPRVLVVFFSLQMFRAVVVNRRPRGSFPRDAI